MRARRISAILVAGVGTALLAVFLAFPLGDAIRVATGLTSHTLCSAVFVSGLAANEVYAETIKPTPGLAHLDWALRYTVDATSRKVTTTWAGRFESQAVYRERLGCLLVRGSPSAEEALPPVPAKAPGPYTTFGSGIAGPAIVEPPGRKLREAVDKAFAAPPYRTKAIVIVRDDRVIAERYAPGYGIDTPLIGWSMTKSVINALVGILVREHRLVVNAPAPVADWRGKNDPRHAISIDQLMRMTSGLALDESYTGFDPATHMLFLEDDMAAFAERASLKASPGNQWEYTGGNTLILSRIIRDAVGGHPGDVLAFAQRELFSPLGMHSVVLEFDATGTPIGSTYMYASARDWARFGLLYLNDGEVAGRRLLPEGWVRDSTTPTIHVGYGAGWWTNRQPSGLPLGHERQGLPGDAYWAAGALGQRVIVIPSERLVIVRLGVSGGPGIGGSVKEVIAALDNPDEGQ